MAKKDRDLLIVPLALSQTRYREQVNAFKNQYLPKPNSPIQEFFKSANIDPKEWGVL